jgi:hypothetical protein
MTNRFPERTLWFAVLGLGAALRIWQYAGNPSLWIDELALGRTVIERSLPDLLGRPLDYHQVAPPGFLLIAKLATLAFGESELALRLVPLVAGLASLPLFLALARRAAPPPARLPAGFLFATAPFLVLGSADFKQYSTDVLAATVVALLAARRLASPGGRRAWQLGAAMGSVASWSHPLAFTGPGVLAALLWGARRQRTARSLLPGAGLGLAGIAGAVLLAEGSLTGLTRQRMNGTWAWALMP